MYSLDRAVALVLKRPAARAPLVKYLQAVCQECEAAWSVWQKYLEQPGSAGDRFSILSWVGTERARQLHEINLRAREQLRAAATLAGPEAGRFMNLEDDVIEMAYRNLNAGETGPQAAQKALDRMTERLRELRAIITKVNTAPAPKAAPKTAKKAAKKAPPKKKAAKKAVKAKPKKKAPKKK
jgi:hypothetical protein